MSSMMSSKLIASPSYMVFGLIKNLRPFVCRPTERRSRFSVCLLNNYANKAICRHEMLFFLSLSFPPRIFRPLASHIFHIHSMPCSLTFHANPSLNSLPATDDDFIIQLHFFALIFDSAVWVVRCGMGKFEHSSQARKNPTRKKNIKTEIFLNSLESALALNVMWTMCEGLTRISHRHRSLVTIAMGRRVWEMERKILI